MIVLLPDASIVLWTAAAIFAFACSLAVLGFAFAVAYVSIRTALVTGRLPFQKVAAQFGKDRALSLEAVAAADRVTQEQLQELRDGLQNLEQRLDFVARVVASLAPASASELPQLHPHKKRKK